MPAHACTRMRACGARMANDQRARQGNIHVIWVAAGLLANITSFFSIMLPLQNITAHLWLISRYVLLNEPTSRHAALHSLIRVVPGAYDVHHASMRIVASPHAVHPTADERRVKWQAL